MSYYYLYLPFSSTLYDWFLERAKSWSASLSFDSWLPRKPHYTFVPTLSILVATTIALHLDAVSTLHNAR